MANFTTKHAQVVQCPCPARLRQRHAVLYASSSTEASPLIAIVRSLGRKWTEPFVII